MIRLSKRIECRTLQILTFFLISGCIPSGPSEIQVIVQGSAAKSLVRDIASSDFMIYNISREQVNNLTNVYNDFVLSNDFILRGNYKNYNQFTDQLLTPELSNFYRARLFEVASRIDYSSAEARYKTSLDKAQEELSNIEASYDDIKNLFTELELIDQAIENNNKRIAKKKQMVRSKLVSLEEDATNILITHNQLWANRAVDTRRIRLNSFQFVSTNKKTCYRSFKKYDIQYHTHNRCFVLNLPTRFTSVADSLKSYSEIFKQYIDQRVLLSNNRPMLKGTLEYERDKLNKEATKLKENFIRRHGSLHNLKKQRDSLSRKLNSQRSVVESMVINRNQLLNSYLTDEISDLKAVIKQGASLSNPDSPLYQVSLVTLKSIRSQTLDRNKRTSFSNTSMMILAQVNAQNRAKFPIFINPVIVEQKAISEMDIYKLYLTHDNIEHVAPEGVVHTIVTLVGESFLDWKKSG